MLLLSALDEPSNIKHFRFYFNLNDQRSEFFEEPNFNLEQLVFDLDAVMVNRQNQVKIKGTLHFLDQKISCDKLILIVEHEEIISKTRNTEDEAMLRLPSKKILSLNEPGDSTYLQEAQFKHVANFFMKNEQSEMCQISKEVGEVLFNLLETSILTGNLVLKKTLVTFLLAKGNLKILRQLLTSTSEKRLPLRDLSRMFELTVVDQVGSLRKILDNEANLNQIFEPDATLLDLDKRILASNESPMTASSVFNLEHDFIDSDFVFVQNNQRDIFLVSRSRFSETGEIENSNDRENMGRFLPLPHMSPKQYVLKMMKNISSLIDCFRVKILRESKKNRFENQFVDFLDSDKIHLEKIRSVGAELRTLSDKFKFLCMINQNESFLPEMAGLLQKSSKRKLILNKFTENQNLRQLLDPDFKIERKMLLELPGTEYRAMDHSLVHKKERSDPENSQNPKLGVKHCMPSYLWREAIRSLDKEMLSFDNVVLFARGILQNKIEFNSVLVLFETINKLKSFYLKKSDKNSKLSPKHKFRISREINKKSELFFQSQLYIDEILNVILTEFETRLKIKDNLSKMKIEEEITLIPKASWKHYFYDFVHINRFDDLATENEDLISSLLDTESNGPHFNVLDDIWVKKVLFTLKNSNENLLRSKEILALTEQTRIKPNLYKHFLWLVSFSERMNQLPLYVSHNLRLNLAQSSDLNILSHLGNLKMTFQALSMINQPLDCYFLFKQFISEHGSFVTHDHIIIAFFGVASLKVLKGQYSNDLGSKRELLLGYLVELFDKRKKVLKFLSIKLTPQDEKALEAFIFRLDSPIKQPDLYTENSNRLAYFC